MNPGVRYFQKLKLSVRVTLLVVLSATLLGVCWWGVLGQMKGTNQAVNDLAELKDPSPFRAALMGYLGKIHLGLEGYLRSSDPALIEQVAQSRNDFDASLPEFEKQNPRLFPKVAVEEIRRTFDLFKQSIEQTLTAHAKRAVTRNALDKSFARIITLIDHDIKPLLRGDQGEGEDRKDTVLDVENQARAWQQNLAKAWAQPSQSASELTYENDSRGGTYLERYARMELLPRERKVLKEIRTLWQSIGDLGRESFALEKIVATNETFMDGQRNQVVNALNKYLPAMPPAELEARKQSYARSIQLHFAAIFLLGAIALLSVTFLAIWIYRMSTGRYPVKVPRPGVTPADGKAGSEPTLQMDLKGVISNWSPAAEMLYGYGVGEMRGQPISKLFESESEITRLYKDLLDAPQTIFQTTHRTKSGHIIRVRIEFQPASDAAGHTSGIGLICTRT